MFIFIDNLFSSLKTMQKVSYSSSGPNCCNNEEIISIVETIKKLNAETMQNNCFVATMINKLHCCNNTQ